MVVSTYRLIKQCKITCIICPLSYNYRCYVLTFTETSLNAAHRTGLRIRRIISLPWVFELLEEKPCIMNR